MNLDELRKKIYYIHDVECNQKYGDGLPYSFHLKCVEAQGEKFLYLISNSIVENSLNRFSYMVSLGDVIRLSLSAHDIIEDGRMTFNNIMDLASDLGNSVAGRMVADIVYCVTDEKGKSRDERKNDKYYKELSSNNLAVFVKMADLCANTLYSKLTNSIMYDKYKREFVRFKEKCYIEEYKEFFDYLENL